MGAAASKNNQYVFLTYGIKPEKLISINNNYYANLDREETKLPDDILKSFEKNNNFSKEDVDDPPKELQTKNTKKNGKN